MKKLMHVVLSFVLLLLSSNAASFENDSNAASLRGSTPIQLFMQICVVGRGNPELAARGAEKMGFDVAPDDRAEMYLSGNPGRAWFRNDESGAFGLTLLSNGLCSVFVHQGNPATLQESMESWLPPEDSGFSYKKEQVPQGSFLETTAFQIFKSGRFIEQWMITTNAQPNPELVAIMTYEAA